MAENHKNKENFFSIILFFIYFTAVISIITASMLLIIETLVVVIISIKEILLTFGNFVKIYYLFFRQKLLRISEKRQTIVNQPAYQNYFYRNSFTDLEYIISETRKHTHKRLSKPTISLTEYAVNIIKPELIDSTQSSVILFFWISEIPQRVLRYISLILSRMVCILIYQIHFLLLILCYFFSILITSFLIFRKTPK